MAAHRHDRASTVLTQRIKQRVRALFAASSEATSYDIVEVESQGGARNSTWEAQKRWINAEERLTRAIREGLAHEHLRWWRPLRIRREWHSRRTTPAV